MYRETEHNYHCLTTRPPDSISRPQKIRMFAVEAILFRGVCHALALASIAWLNVLAQMITNRLGF